MADNENLNDVTDTKQTSGADKINKAGNAAAGAVKKGKLLARFIKSLKGLGALGVVGIIIIIVIVVIILIVGIIGFFLEMPGLLTNKLSGLASDFCTELATYYSGNSARFGTEEQKDLAEYLSNMGYEPYEFGFGKYTDEDGNIIENADDDDATISSKYLNAYLTADYNTYVPYEKFKGGVSKLLHVIGDAIGYVLGMETEKDTGDPQFGMLYFDKGMYENAEGTDGNAKKMSFLDSVSTDVDSKTLTFKVWEAPFKYSYYTYNMEGWTARYGKPLELSLTLHLATMAPDLVYRFDMDKEESTEIHIKTIKSNATIKFEYRVENAPEGGTNFASIDDSLANLDMHVSSDGGTLTVEDLQTLKDFIDSHDESDMVKNIQAGYSNFEAFINASIDSGNNRKYLRENESILQRYDGNDNSALLNYDHSIENMFNTYLDDAIKLVKEEDENVTFYTDEVGKSYAEIVGKTVHDSTFLHGGWTYGDNTTGIMDEFYKKFEEAKSDDELTEEEEEELFTFLQDKFKEIQPQVKEDVDKLVEKDAKLAEELKKLTEELEKIGLSIDAINAAIEYNNDNGQGGGTTIERVQPYITEVKKHWYRDVIFKNDDYDAYDWSTSQATYENKFEPVEQSDDSVLAPNDIGAFYTIETVGAGSELVQVRDAIRGKVNEHTKELFVGTEGNPAKYFIYDGSKDTAEKIDELREVYDEAYSKSWDENQSIFENSEDVDKQARKDAEAAVEAKEDEEGINLYKEVNVRQNALSAFSILENSKTEDSEYILRDLKKFFVDLGYFTKDDLRVDDTHVFQWPIGGYVNLYWPVRRYEKQQADYGTLIRSKVSTDNIKAGYEADGSERIKEDEEVNIYKPNFNPDSEVNSEVAPDDPSANNNQTTTSTSDDFVTEFLNAAQEVTDYVRENGFTYGNAEYMPPKNGETNSDGVKRISCDRLVSWALYKCGYTDQPEYGLTTSAAASPLMSYCKEKAWLKIENVDEIQAGDIVFVGETNADKTSAAHVFICAGENKRYDCGNATRIQSQQPFNEEIHEPLVCAYRPESSDSSTTQYDGFEADLNVVSPVTGEIIEEGDDYIKIKVLDTSSISEYKRFYEEYKGICTGYIMYIKGFKKGTIDANAQSEYQQVKHTKRYFIENGYADDYRDAETIAEEFEKEEQERIDAPAYIEKDGKRYIKEGTVIGTTTNSDIALYLLNRENSIVEDVESYIRLVDNQLETDWAYFYWVPYESGGTDTPGGGPEAVGLTTSGELAVGISQWTTTHKAGSPNNIPEFCEKAIELNPGLCSELQPFVGKSIDEILAMEPQIKSAFQSICAKDRDGFLEVQMQVTINQYLIEPYTGTDKEWLLDKNPITQGTFMSLVNWGMGDNFWFSAFSQSDSDEQAVKSLLTKALGVKSTAGFLTSRWTSQYVLAKDALTGAIDEEGIINWIKTKQPSDKYGEGQNMSALP